MTIPFDQLDPRDFIIIKGAKVNNLKNLSVAIPRNKLVVITGVSGSGKSSLAFNTLFAEGQRMYVESLNSYARQFLGRMEKPEVEYIKGVSPAIAIEQKVSTKNPRSTVGTSTEIYDYLKLLFARIGKTYSPISGIEVKKESVSDVMEYLYNFPAGTRVQVLAPLLLKGRPFKEELNVLLQKGFTRIVLDGEPQFIEEFLAEDKKPGKNSELFILIDRNSIQPEDEDSRFRMADSVQTAFFEGEGECLVDVVGTEKRLFSNTFELDGIVFEEPSINLFTFNNPYGACKTCEGFGHVLGIDENLVIPNKNLSVYEGTIAPWKGEKMNEWQVPLVKNALKFDFPIHRPYYDLTEAQKQVLWDGNQYFEGLNAFFKSIESQLHKIQYRVMLSRYRGRTVCPDCKGSRLRKDAGYVKIDGKSIIDLVLLPIEQLSEFINGVQLSEFDAKVAGRILKEIKNRLGYLEDVGLGYLTLNRLTGTLSGGEFQRIKLATSLGSALVGSMYILDEPSIGLHPRDTTRLIKVLKTLRDLGNTVIVVEHEEEVMKAADQIIDIGPNAGNLGGELINQLFLTTSGKNGHAKLDFVPVDGHLINNDSHTIRFLTGEETIPLPPARRKAHNFIEVIGARENNLKNVSVRFPLHVLTVVTGVSGSGKSTLIKKVVFPSLKKIFGGFDEETGKVDFVKGALQSVQRVEFVDQNPIGKSSRSNPITYIKAYDVVRDLYADQALSKARGYKPGHFSFNVDGGRCDLCQGEGEVKVEMQFMADIYLKCESCGGKRFKNEVLEVKYKEKDISDVLDMTVDESVVFFKDQNRLVEKLMPLQDVGLGYVKLGQSSNTLSGGEAQRVKLASFIGAGQYGHAKEHIVFIFDEPTTGLHFSDIKKLMDSINRLVDQGNTAIIIEHNMDVIKCADWIIDMGPEGGQKGGYVCFEGTPEEMVKIKDNHTAHYLKEKMRH